MTISRVGFSKALGDTISWPSGHRSQDLAIVFAHLTGVLAITPPSGWYTVQAVTNTQSRAIFFCWADSDEMASATFTNAEFLHMWVGRSDSALLVVGGWLSTVTGSTTTWTYSGFTVQNFEATSKILYSACSAATDNSEYVDAPFGYTNIDNQLDLSTQVGASNLIEKDDLTSSVSSTSVSGSGTAGAIARLGIEVFEMPLVFGSLYSQNYHPLGF